MDGTAISLASTFGFGAANMAHSLTPSLTEVRAGDPNDADMKSKVRTGECAAVLIVGATGLILWTLTGETLPLVLSGSILGMTFLAYEYALRKPKEQPTQDANGTPIERAVLAYK